MASQFDDLLSGVVNKLKGLGIGTKSPEQQAREADPVLKAQFERRIPTYDEIRESRRLRGERRQPSPYTQDLRTPSNIQAQEGQGTVGPAEYYDFNTRTDYSYEAPEYSKTMNFGTGLLSGKGLGLAAPATSYSAAPESAGGAINRGMYSTGRGFYQDDTMDGGVAEQRVYDPELVKRAGGKASDVNPLNIVYVDPYTMRERIVDAQGRDYDRADVVEMTEADSLAAGVSLMPKIEGSPPSYIFDGVKNLFSGLFSQEDKNLPAEVTSNPLYSEGYFTSTPEAVDAYKRRQAERAAQREAALANNIPQEQQDMEMRRMLSQAETAQRRQANLDAAGMDMPYQGQQINYDAFGNVIDLPEYEVNMDTTPTPKGEEEQGMFDTMMDLLVSPVYGAETVQTAPTEYGDFGEVVNASTARFISPAAAQSDQLLTRHLGRLGADSPEARSRLAELASKVAMIESDGNMRAKNKDSSATGLYQFLVDDSKGQSALQTAVKRTKKYVQADWLDEVAKTGKVEDLSAEKQTILFLGDILEKEGSDKYVKKLLDPNSSEKEVKDSMMQIYLKLHHTNPDEATLNRAKKYIK